jgi:glycosyltransferase involved in cell wall biosynthesis
MMFRIVLPRKTNITEQMDLAARGMSPRHSVALIAENLAATLHEPDVITHFPLRSRLLPTDELWSLASKVKAAATPKDVIFCVSEGAGLQLASLYFGVRSRPRIAVFVHNVDRPRARAAMRLWCMKNTVDLFIACSEYQREFLKSYLSVSDDRVKLVDDCTDDRFFTPGPPSVTKKRPLVVSVGLEQRDYKTLALATSDMNIDVRISGFSKDAKGASAFPDRLPDNMERNFYKWPDLVQLYRDADAVVVSCYENKYAAGVQSLMEGSSCGRPIIVTRTSGLSSYLNNSVVSIRSGSSNEMASAIQSILVNREFAERQANLAQQEAKNRYTMDRYVSEVSDALRRL